MEKKRERIDDIQGERLSDTRCRSFPSTRAGTYTCTALHLPSIREKRVPVGSGEAGMREQRCFPSTGNRDSQRTPPSQHHARPLNNALNLRPHVSPFLLREHQFVLMCNIPCPYFHPLGFQRAIIPWSVSPSTYVFHLQFSTKTSYSASYGNKHPVLSPNRQGAAPTQRGVASVRTPR